jgi:hypothetical protein
MKAYIAIMHSAVNLHQELRLLDGGAQDSAVEQRRIPAMANVM